MIGTRSRAKRRRGDLGSHVGRQDRVRRRVEAAGRQARHGGREGRADAASGSTTPMTPVGARNTCCRGRWRSSDARRRTLRAASAPARPVMALAHPALITAARTRPPLERSAARERTTGAAGKRFRVKSAAAVAPFSQTRRARSGRLFRERPGARDSAAPYGGMRLPEGDAAPRDRVGEVRREEAFVGRGGLHLSAIPRSGPAARRQVDSSM